MKFLLMNNIMKMMVIKMIEELMNLVEIPVEESLKSRTKRIIYSFSIFYFHEYIKLKVF